MDFPDQQKSWPVPLRHIVRFFVQGILVIFSANEFDIEIQAGQRRYSPKAWLGSIKCTGKYLLEN